jgi:hypothetical protein
MSREFREPGWELKSFMSHSDNFIARSLSVENKGDEVLIKEPVQQWLRKGCLQSFFIQSQACLRVKHLIPM